MFQASTSTPPPDAAAERRDKTVTFVTFTVAGQLFGVSVEHVQDILTLEAIAAVPLGPAEVKGMINLRGRIVTVIDVRTRLGLPAEQPGRTHHAMGVTVENGLDFYTLLVDSVGDVVSLAAPAREPNPSTLDPLWRAVADGVFRTDRGLLVVLDVASLLDIRASA